MPLRIPLPRGAPRTNADCACSYTWAWTGPPDSPLGHTVCTHLCHAVLYMHADMFYPHLSVNAAFTCSYTRYGHLFRHHSYCSFHSPWDACLSILAAVTRPLPTHAQFVTAFTFPSHLTPPSILAPSATCPQHCAWWADGTLKRAAPCLTHPSGGPARNLAGGRAWQARHWTAGRGSVPAANSCRLRLPYPPAFTLPTPHPLPPSPPQTRAVAAGLRDLLPLQHLLLVARTSARGRRAAAEPTGRTPLCLSIPSSANTHLHNHCPCPPYHAFLLPPYRYL